MAELPPDAGPDEFRELRAPRQKPLIPGGHIPPTGKGKPPTMRSHGTARQARAAALIAEGSWWLSCPFCPGVGPGLHPGGARLDTFRCPICQNEAAGRRPVETLWPTTTHTKVILSVLAVRDKPNRNWLPWEPISQLEQENIDADLPPRGLL